MSKPPIAAPQTEGRVYGTDWSMRNLATLLRSNAGRGLWHLAGTPGGSMAKVNHNYIRTVSALHLPTSVSLIFMRLEYESCWYASLGFVGTDNYLPWNAGVAERWLWALFGEDRPRVLEGSAIPSEDPRSQSVRQFSLAR